MTHRFTACEAGCAVAPNATIAASFASALLTYAMSHGADRSSILRDAGIRRDELTDPDARLALPRYVTMLRTAARLCAIPSFALRFGEHVRFDEVSILGSHGAPVDGARLIQRLNRSVPLALDDGRRGRADDEPFVLAPGDAGVWIEFTSPVYRAYPELLESALARGVCDARARIRAAGGAASGAAPVLRGLEVMHPAPDYASEYTRIFGVRTRFSANRNAVLVDPALLQLTIAGPGAAAARVLSSHAERLLARLEASRSIRGQVEAALRRRLGRERLRMVDVARELGVSRPTLFRRLRQEGATFEAVLDATRHDAAVRLLDGEQRTVGQTAALLGYSEPAAFSRAFKRWTGSRPRAKAEGHRRGAGTLCTDQRR